MADTPTPSAVAQHVVPRLTWSEERGFDASRELRERALALGVGGFVLGAAPQDDVRALTKELRTRSRHPLLIAADMERGAGQAFGGATGVPPLAALAALDDADAVRKAARLTAREARTLGVTWALAPVLDLDVDPANPIVGSRAFGGDPALVAKLGTIWIEACQQEGVLACAKHFPGHGRTVTDSHLERPAIRVTRHELMERDLVPFRAAIKAGVASMMTAHVAFPKLDPAGPPATLSMAIVRVLLRERLGFDGLVVTDALNMRALTSHSTETDAAVAALFAGCDLVLMPTDLDACVAALTEAVADGTLDAELLLRSQRRRLKWAQWAAPPSDWRRASTFDVASGNDLAERVITAVRGEVGALGATIELFVVDDDAGLEGAPPRGTLAASLRGSGFGVRDPGPLAAGATRVVALFGDVIGGKGRAGYSPEALVAVNRAVADAEREGRRAVVVQFGHPRLAAGIVADTVVTAWCGERAMQEAAARWLARRRGAGAERVTA
ncbi:MAG TPA: glycoside hydrolase family 3 N-terminal domain-containing protein [Gemmatimonadaceae bacterium]|nr:glycoside hydrolase family 3 N-terminal domain-containing protein [Gemmatimonadaceae bacterium]